MKLMKRTCIAKRVLNGLLKSNTDLCHIQKKGYNEPCYTDTFIHVQIIPLILYVLLY